MNISQLHSSGRRASDMSKVLTTCFRFNMDNPEHAKAWDYLHNFDKDKIKSTNVAAITAVNDYFDRMGRLADDPYFDLIDL